MINWLKDEVEPVLRDDLLPKGFLLIRLND